VWARRVCGGLQMSASEGERCAGVRDVGYSLDVTIERIMEERKREAMQVLELLNGFSMPS